MMCICIIIIVRACVLDWQRRTKSMIQENCVIIILIIVIIIICACVLHWQRRTKSMIEENCVRQASF